MTLHIMLAALTGRQTRAVKEQLEGQRGMKIVGQVDALGVPALRLVGDAKASVVVSDDANPNLPAFCTHLVGEYPDLIVVGVAGAGAPATLYQRRAVLRQVDREKLKGLAEVILCAM